MGFFLKDINLKGKTALITGATKGLGRGAAEAIAEAGGDIIAIGRNDSELNSLAKVIRKLKVKYTSFNCDVNNYNQMKGIDLFGNFKDNELEKIRLNRNTEMIYYLYDEESKELIGIDKAICSSILMTINNNKIDEIIFYTNPEGKVYPEMELEINEKILNGFNWRINEKILNKENLINN